MLYNNVRPFHYWVLYPHSRESDGPHLSLAKSLQCFLKDVKDLYWSRFSGMDSRTLLMLTAHGERVHDQDVFNSHLSPENTGTMAFLVEPPDIRSWDLITYARRIQAEMSSVFTLRTVLTDIAGYFDRIFRIPPRIGNFPTVGDLLYFYYSNRWTPGYEALDIYTDREWEYLGNLNRIVSRRAHDPDYPQAINGGKLLLITQGSVLEPEESLLRLIRKISCTEVYVHKTLLYD